MRNVNILQSEEYGWLKFYGLASAYAADEQFAMAFLYANQALECKDAVKETKDFLRYCCGYFLLASDQLENGLRYLKNSQYPDAIYLRAINSNKHTETIRLLEKFLTTAMPTSSPTKWIEYRITTKNLLKEIYDNKLIELQDA